jgi:DNA-3-methyladenine glycosylase
MYGPPGTVYIHLNFGVHWCLNVVVESEGYPAAVLIRAVEPVEGLEVMRERRPGRPDLELTSGPGKLTRALGIGPELQRHTLTDGQPLFLARGQSVPAAERVQTTRVGISKGAEERWRFYDRRSPWVTQRDRNAEGA